MTSIGQYEWGILFLILIGVLVWELMRTRRAIRRDKESDHSFRE